MPLVPSYGPGNLFPTFSELQTVQKETSGMEWIKTSKIRLIHKPFTSFNFPSNI